MELHHTIGKKGTHTTQAGGAAPSRSPARILVVDDLEEIRNTLERRLRRRGYVVECAENGRVALEMIAEHAFDLVLLDIEMPEVNGYEVL